MDRPVTIRLGMAADASALTVTICDIDGPPLAHATLNAQQLRQLAVNLVQALAHLEGRVPPPDAKRGKRTPTPAPIPLPAWRVAPLATGEAVMSVEIFPGLWTSFSLSAGDGKKLAAALEKRLNSKSASGRPRRRT